MAIEENTLEPKQGFEQTKTDTEEFLGGCSIDLDREMSGGGILREKLKHEISTSLEQELTNHLGIVEKLEEHQKQFRGELKEKVFPYEGCSNLNIPITRWLVDTVLVRIIDVIFGQRKVWVLRALKPEFKDIVKDLEDGLDWWQKHIAKFRDQIFSPLMQAVKMGTGVVGFKYERKKRTVYRYASEAEKANRDIKKYKTKEGEKLIKQPQTIYEGPTLFGVSLEDWISSADSPTIKDAYIAGYRTYVRKAQVETHVRSGYYYDDILDHLRGDATDEVKKARAEAEGKEISEFDRERLQVWVLHLKYDVDDDGEEDDIVVTWHQETGTILRAIYNPYFFGFRPFEKLVGLPVEFSFYGTGLCEMLKHIQEEMNSQHNQRVDRLNQINSLMWKIRQGSGVENDKIYPGKKWVVGDIDKDIGVVQTPDVFYSTFQEETLLNSYAEKTVGVAPGVMGIPTAERPVARETMALIQEANKKFKFIIDNIREVFKEIGMKVLEMFAQYQPTLTLRVDEEGETVSKTIDFPLEFIRDGIAIELTASSELLNQEVRRERNMHVYNLMKDYMQQIGMIVQTIGSGMVPPAMIPFFAANIAIGNKMMKEILQDFEIIDAEDIIGQLEKSIDVKQLMQQAQQMQQQMMMQQQMAQAQQGQQARPPQRGKKPR